METETDLDLRELRRAIRDAARRQRRSEEEVVRQLIDIADSDGYGRAT